MIEEGLFERFPCDAVFAMHNMPGWPVGQFMFKDQTMMASADRVVVTFHGKGGHGAVPHRAVDPTIAAARTILALQTIVSRSIDPLQGVVLSVRSEARRGGKECVSTCRYQLSPFLKKTITMT